VHFWALVFMYIWAGPHHLLYTALPDWAQSMGMVFSLMLWAPSWGGMLNGLLTLRGAWDKVRADPVLKFFVAGVTFYGMATFEGPLLSIKSVSALAHYTDWIIAHVHGGALGWNGFMAAGMFYWLFPRLWGTTLYNPKWANAHFWMGTLGIILYMISMWISGISQGLMLQAQNADGGLVYSNFVETLQAIRPLYITRAIGGGLYLAGYVLMVVNLLKTVASGSPVNGTAEVVVLDEPSEGTWVDLLTGRPVIISAVGLVLLFGMGVADLVNNVVFSVLGLTLVGYLVVSMAFGEKSNRISWHRLLEGKSLVFSVFVLIAVLIGGMAELIPTIFVKRAAPDAEKGAVPYTALEVQGRDIYVREGCYNCHSQMIRPLLAETIRYGEPSTIGESTYDHPFQWGSKRTGPDLARVGTKYPNLWHYEHLKNPRNISPGSNMPDFAWMADTKLNLGATAVKLNALRTLGTPYSASDIAGGNQALEVQARVIVESLEKEGAHVAWDSEMVALIAYLQRLGKPPAPRVPAVTMETGAH
jgi:cytochrome c oxidase cbb3-type subunit I/II